MIHILEPNNGAKASSLDANTRRTVRSHAMRHFRQQQKKARSGGRVSIFDTTSDVSDSIVVLDEASLLRLLPAPVKHKGENSDPQTSGREPMKEGNEQNSVNPAHPAVVTRPFQWSEISGWQCNLEIPQLSNGATVYRYMLAEMFGASFIGSGTQRIRSAGLLAYRGYVDSTRSDLLRATDDSLCLLLPGCFMEDARVLLEARKRHLAGVQCMQRAVGAHMHDAKRSREALSTVAGAVEILFLGMFNPVSAGSDSAVLYDGLVHIVRSHWTHLTSFQSSVPVTRWVLAQLRQIMLMHSLTRGTALPIKVEAWQSIPHASGLIPEMSEALMPLAIQTPALLDTARGLLHSSEQDQALFKSALTGTASLDARLVQWQREWCGEMADLDYLAKSVDRTGPDHEDRLPSLDALRSKTLYHAQCLSLCYICLLLLRESAANLSAALDDDATQENHNSQAGRTANGLFELAKFLAQEDDGMLSRALSVAAPLHFGGQWYERNDDHDNAAAVEVHKSRMLDAVPFLSWTSLVELGLGSLYINT